MNHKARNDGSMDDDMDQTWMTNGWWMTDAMCFLPTFQVETGPISQILLGPAHGQVLHHHHHHHPLQPST